MPTLDNVITNEHDSNRHNVIDVVFRTRNNGEVTRGKEGFWQPFLYYFRNSEGRERITEDVLEGRIRNHFPQALREYILSATSRGETTDKRDVGFAIAVKYMEYGSLDIGLIFEPLEKVSKFFENNFDYFDTFLKSYIPLAFATALERGSVSNLYWRDVVNEMEVDITTNSSFRNNFQSMQVMSTPATRTLLDRANWLWIISNTSLVIPVLIACIFLYFSYNRLRYNEEMINQNNQELYKLQTEIIKSFLTDKKTNQKDTVPH